jgi:DNA recombination protein RmuC
MQITSVLAVLALGAAVGAVIVWLFMRARVHAAFERGRSEAAVQLATSVERARHLEGRAAELEREHRALADQVQALNAQLGSAREESARLRASLDAETRKAEEKLKVLSDARDALADQFRNLANQIFDEKGTKFVQQNQATLDQMLKPLGERLREFQAKVEETYDKESKQRFSLQHEVQRLLELNTRLSQDATNLTNALKGDSKTQGVWGELVLETILEASGLRKGREYDAQVSLDTEEGGKLQPDIVVHLPDNKHVVIDSKVSLTAYEAYVSAVDDEVRQQELARHVASVRRHVGGLAGKSYPDLYGLESLDFVLMFVPIESALTLVAQGDEKLFLEAFNKGVMIVSPTTLLISLRTIAGIWRYEYQNRNAQELVRQCAAMYDKFVGFVADLEDVGKKIDLARSSYDAAYSKLKTGRGNLIRQAERVRDLGLKPNKALPQQLTDAATED